MPRRPRIEIVEKLDSKKLEMDLIKAKNLEERDSIIYQASQEGVS